jgi:DUF1365 family protein
MRLIPRRHRFRYRVFSILVDLDRLDGVVASSRILRRNRFGILSFNDRDHGARDGSDLRGWVDAELARAGFARPARVELLCFPRMWGFVFNPLSVYYCFGADDALHAVLYEVKNTFGEQIAYVIPAGPERGGAHRHCQMKAMPVSPFIGMDQTYRFDVSVPGERLALRIRQAGPEGETLIATQTARARPFSDAALARAVLGHPLMTIKVFAAIHWEALRLWMKGVRIPRPQQPEAARG